MPSTTQLNLPLDNDIGTLARLCRDLAKGGVNLLAIAAPETGNDGGVRLLVVNRDLAVRALSKAGYLFSEERVLFVEVTNRPGAQLRPSCVRRPNALYGAAGRLARLRTKSGVSSGTTTHCSSGSRPIPKRSGIAGP